MRFIAKSFLILILPVYISVAAAEPLANLQRVGQAKLSVFIWDVYDSYLYSEDGKYSPEQYPMALRIQYLRDIEAADLVDQTEEEWLKLGIEKEDFKSWLVRVADIWPDIKKGDELLLRVDKNLESRFYFNGEFIGALTDPRFGSSFLDIWLSPNCSYPKVRNALIGL